MATGWLCHELYMWHDTGSSAGLLPAGLSVQPGTPYENPKSKRRFRNLVEVSGLADRLIRLRPRYATEREVARVHTRAYIDKIKSMSAAGGGDASDLTPFGRGSFEIALPRRRRHHRGRRRSDQRRSVERLRPGPAARPSCHIRPRHGLLPVRQCRASPSGTPRRPMA